MRTSPFPLPDSEWTVIISDTNLRDSWTVELETRTKIWQPWGARASSLPVSTALSLSVRRAPALHNALRCASALNWTIQRETKEDESWSQWAGIQSFLTAAGGRRQGGRRSKRRGNVWECDWLSARACVWRNRGPRRVQVDRSLYSPSSSYLHCALLLYCYPSISSIINVKPSSAPWSRSLESTRRNWVTRTEDDQTQRRLDGSGTSEDRVFPSRARFPGSGKH